MCGYVCRGCVARISICVTYKTICSSINSIHTYAFRNAENLKKLNEREIELGIAGTKTSWHNIYKESAWIFVGGLPYDLTEGDVICVFSQYVIAKNIVSNIDNSTQALCPSSSLKISFDLLKLGKNCIYRYGEIVNINMVRDKKTGKTKGFAFICYEDQRSTILAVDNLNGIKVSDSYHAPSVNVLLVVLKLVLCGALARM